MRKSAEAVSVIGGDDGPTSVFLLEKNAKLTWKQQIHRFKYRLKRAYVVRKIKAESHTLEEVMEYMQRRTPKAMEVPTEDFDIDFHKFVKTAGGRNDNMSIVIEKRFAYIGGGVVGNKKMIKEFNRIFKDIYRYYGVTREDINSESPRYKELIRTLSR